MSKSTPADTYVFGYAIRRIRQSSEAGTLVDEVYEILCPVTGSRLATRPTRQLAERFVLNRELDESRTAVRPRGQRNAQPTA